MDSLNAREREKKKGKSDEILCWLSVRHVALAASGGVGSREGVELGRFYFTAEMSNCCLVISSGYPRSETQTDPSISGIKFAGDGSAGTA